MSTKPLRPYREMWGEDEKDPTRRRHGNSQQHWYKHVSDFVRDRDVLDFGCSMARKHPHLWSKGPASLTGYDISQAAIDEAQCLGDAHILTADRSALRSSYDVVLAIDVIEHVEEDIKLLRELAGLSSSLLYITTPNGVRYMPRSNRYHCRAYKPAQFESLILDVFRGDVKFAYARDGIHICDSIAAVDGTIKHMVAIVKF